MRRLWASAPVLMLGSLAPAQALGCSSCFLGQEGERVAYYLSTMLMLLLPLVLVLGLGFCLARAARANKVNHMPSPFWDTLKGES